MNEMNGMLCPSNSKLQLKLGTDKFRTTQSPLNNQFATELIVFAIAFVVPVAEVAVVVAAVTVVIVIRYISADFQ